MNRLSVLAVVRKTVTAPQKPRGFTLIELMVTIVIVGILAAIALPSYQNYVKKGRRVDAKTALLDFAAREEKWFAINNTYTTSAASLGYASNPIDITSSGAAYYTLTILTGTATGFTAQAAPKTGSAQVGDTCGTYTIDNLGNQGNSTGTALACW